MTPLEDCCYRCVGCARVVCGDNETSPGEVDLLCPECWLTEDPEAAA